jgi:lipase
VTERLNVISYGAPDAEPLLAVHGITGFGARFGRLAEEGVPERRWICPDLRGHGSSPATPPWATDVHVADVVRVLDEAGVAQVDVVGHSFGGHVALHLLAGHPERVRDLVLLDPASASEPERLEEAATAFARDPGWATRDAARAEMLEWFGGPTDELEVELATVEEDGSGRWRLPCSVPVIVAAYGEIARPLPALPAEGRRVLLVEAPSEVTTVGSTLRDGLAAAFGDRLERVVLSSGSHVVYRTAFDETAAAVTGFLRARPPERRA